MNPKETIAAFDRFLEARALHLDAVVIGGTALALMGVITRETRDCDVLHPAIPIAVREAARLFAAESRLRGIPLDEKWLAMQDAHPGWSDHIDDTLADLRRRLGHGI